MDKGKWFTSVVVGLVAAIIMLLMLPLIQSTASTANWATVDGAANYLTTKGYIVEALAGIPATRVPFADAAGDVMTSNANFTFTPGTSTLATPNLAVSGTATIGTLDTPTGRGATYVVAASDAPAHVKAQADYVCDGTTDNEEIQAAIDALPVARTSLLGVKLFGEFAISATVELANYLYLDLSEAKLVLDNGVDDDIIRADTKHDIKIYGGILDGNKLNQASGHGININNVSYNVEVSKITTIDTRVFAITVYDSHDVNIHDNIILTPAEDGIVVHRSVGDTTYNIVISCNLVSDFDGTGGSPAVSYEGISLDDGAHDVTITDNILTSGQVGISVGTHSGLPAGYNVIISGNKISDVTEGIYITAYDLPTTRGRNITINGNTIETATSHAIIVCGAFDGVTITENKIVSGGVGILVFDEGAPHTYTTTNVLISNNVIDTTTGNYGMQLQYSADMIVIGNTIDNTLATALQLSYLTRATISDNRITNSGAMGIYAVSSDNIIINSNNVYNPTTKGIYFESSNRAHVSGNTVFNSTAEGIQGHVSNFCVVTDNLSYDDQGGGATQTVGIRLRGTDSVVADNEVGYNTLTGILIQANDCVVSGNNVHHTGQRGIYLDNTGAARTLIIGNKLTSNTTSGITIDAACSLSVVKDNYLYLSTIVNDSTTTKLEGNQNYIVPGEVRTASGTLTAGNANAIAFAWHNPEAQDIYIKKVVITVTTAGGTIGSQLDVGIADDAAGTNRGTEFFDDLLLNDVDVNDSWLAGDGGTQTKWVFCQDSASATDGWIVGQILTQNAASLVGSWYVEYVGK